MVVCKYMGDTRECRKGFERCSTAKLDSYSGAIEMMDDWVLFFWLQFLSMFSQNLEEMIEVDLYFLITQIFNIWYIYQHLGNCAVLWSPTISF